MKFLDKVKSDGFGVYDLGRYGMAEINVDGRQVASYSPSTGSLFLDYVPAKRSAQVRLVNMAIETHTMVSTWAGDSLHSTDALLDAYNEQG